MEFANLQYILWPSDNLTELSDEFVARGCRVTLRGGFLAVKALSDKADAVTLAQDYAAALRAHFFTLRLMTLEEFGALPPQGMRVVVGWTKAERENRRAHLRQARQAMVAPDHALLSQCYDYFQSALDDPEHAFFDLYKLVETLEAQYDGEKGAIAVLGPELKKIKREANEPSGDQRHAPPSAQAVKASVDPYKALDVGRSLLTKFEEDIVRSSQDVAPAP
jgi:hypothetical protein